MAKQIGLIKIKGKLGDTSFYKSKDGYLLREKGGVDGNRIKSDPRFKRTRENMSEFGHSTQMASKLRKMLAPVIQKIKDGRMSNRLVAKMREVMDTDITHARGERTVVDGNLGLLTGFDFNSGSPLSTTYFGPFTPNLDRATGDVDIEIPVFDPEDFLASPAESSHFRFVLGVLEWDPLADSGKLVVERSAYLPNNATLSGALNLAGQITANSTLPVLFVLGVEFAQQINGSNYVLSDSGFVSARIVEVSV
ncbi:MAG TPA: hypothetical protein DIW47_09235 [Bacteroidetes bacterium]|nr:hypothetical protein [Bacteroidota bacterium]